MVCGLNWWNWRQPSLVPSSMLLMSISTSLAKNVYSVFTPSATENQIAKLVKYLVPLISLVGIYLTFKGGNSLFSLALIAYNFITQLAPAFFASLMRQNFVTKHGAFAGIITGGVLVLIMGTGEHKNQSTVSLSSSSNKRPECGYYRPIC